MCRYIVQPQENKGTYNVHKFEDEFDEIPVVTYIVTVDRNSKLRCNCPSGRYRGYCKHLNYVREYRKIEEHIKDDIYLIEFTDE